MLMPKEMSLAEIELTYPGLFKSFDNIDACGVITALQELDAYFYMDFARVFIIQLTQNGKKSGGIGLLARADIGDEYIRCHYYSPCSIEPPRNTSYFMAGYPSTTTAIEIEIKRKIKLSDCSNKLNEAIFGYDDYCGFYFKTKDGEQGFAVACEYTDLGNQGFNGQFCRCFHLTSTELTPESIFIDADTVLKLVEENTAKTVKDNNLKYPHLRELFDRYEQIIDDFAKSECYQKHGTSTQKQDHIEPWLENQWSLTRHHIRVLTPILAKEYRLKTS